MSNELNLFESEVEFIEEVKDTQKVQAAEQRLVEMLDKIKVRQENDAAEMERRRQIKGLIEALLFASNEPLSFNKIREVCDEMHPMKPRVLREIFRELQQDLDAGGRAFELEEIAQGYVLRTRSQYGKYIDLLYKSRRGERLSHASLETLSIIAYRQPITRIQIEAVRGVDCSSIVYGLAERGLVEVVGRLDAPGRPSLYATTAKFLQYFGLKSLEELPKLRQDADSSDLKKANEETDTDDNEDLD